MRKGKSWLWVLLIVASVLCGCGSGVVPENNVRQSDAPMQETAGTSGTEVRPGTQEKTPDVQDNVIQLRVSLVQFPSLCVYFSLLLLKNAVKFLDNLPIYKYKCQLRYYSDNHKLHLAKIIQYT